MISNKIEAIKRLRDASIPKVNENPMDVIVDRVEGNKVTLSVYSIPNATTVGLGLKEAKDLVEEIMAFAVNEYINMGHERFSASNPNFTLRLEKKAGGW